MFTKTEKFKNSFKITEINIFNWDKLYVKSLSYHKYYQNLKNLGFSKYV